MHPFPVSSYTKAYSCRHYQIHLQCVLQPFVLRKCCLFWHQGSGDDPVMAAEKERQLKKVQPNCIIEAPKAQAYYHIEYNLLPEDSKPFKVDLVMFGSVAKVYMDNETKVRN